MNINNAFDEFDENVKAISELYNVDFSMKKIKKDEIFDEFLIKFTTTMIDLRFDDEMKISHFRKIMIDRFNYDTKHLFKCKNFKIFCDEIREIALLNKNMNEKKKDEFVSNND